MTEPIQGVVKTDGVERRRNTVQERLRRLYTENAHTGRDEDENDTVDISEEARQRSGGTYRKSILEHLEDDE